VGKKTTATSFYWASMTENVFWCTADKEVGAFGVCDFYMSQ